MIIHRFQYQSFLPITIEEAWQFFSRPSNLSEIAPPELGVEVLGEEKGKQVYVGMAVLHRIRPILRIPMKWLKLVTEVNAPIGYTYVQDQGPYRLWRHRLSFAEVKDGVNVVDDIEYALPLGRLGSALMSHRVKNQIRKIFDSREHILKEVFPRKSELVA